MLIKKIMDTCIVNDKKDHYFNKKQQRRLNFNSIEKEFFSLLRLFFKKKQIILKP